MTVETPRSLEGIEKWDTHQEQFAQQVFNVS